MAQADGRGRSTEDLEIEAAVWTSIGHLRRGEEILVDAYRMGSATAEEMLKNAFVARTGGSRGFDDYLMTRLTGETPELEPAPQIRGTTLEGVQLTSKSLKGKPVVVNFWFTSCGPCIKEIPELNALANEFAGKARFLAFATDDAEPIKEFLKGREFRYEIVPSSSRHGDGHSGWRRTRATTSSTAKATSSGAPWVPPRKPSRSWETSCRAS